MKVRYSLRTVMSAMQSKKDLKRFCAIAGIPSDILANSLYRKKWEIKDAR